MSAKTSPMPNVQTKMAHFARPIARRRWLPSPIKSDRQFYRARNSARELAVSSSLWHSQHIWASQYPHIVLPRPWYNMALTTGSSDLARLGGARGCPSPLERRSGVAAIIRYRCSFLQATKYTYPYLPMEQPQKVTTPITSFTYIYIYICAILRSVDIMPKGMLGRL